MRRICATLMDAEQVLIGNVCQKCTRQNHGLNMINYNPQPEQHTWFIRRLHKMLRCKGFSVWILRMWREPWVQVCTQHMHQDLKIQCLCNTSIWHLHWYLLNCNALVIWTHSRVCGKVCVPFPVFQISSSIPAERAHAAAVGKFYKTNALILSWVKLLLSFSGNLSCAQTAHLS